jgi:hypothetical protein
MANETRHGLTRKSWGITTVSRTCRRGHDPRHGFVLSMLVCGKGIDSDFLVAVYDDMFALEHGEIHRVIVKCRVVLLQSFGIAVCPD